MSRSRRGERKTKNHDLYYESHDNRNVGRITAIEGGEVAVNVNAGHGGGEFKVPIDSCINFKAKVGDRVLLCVDKDGRPTLKVLKKTRQQKK